MSIKRAVVVSFTLKGGGHCKVVYDRFGPDGSRLFAEARERGWSVERTVAQATSNATASVLSEHGPDSIDGYRVDLL